MICKVHREGWGGGCVCTWSTVNLWRSEATVDVAVTFHLSETGPLWFLSLCTWGSCPTSFLTVSTAYLTLETMGYGYMLCGCFCGVLENLHGVPLPHSRTSSHWAFPKALHYLLCVCVIKIERWFYQVQIRHGSVLRLMVSSSLFCHHLCPCFSFSELRYHSIVNGT